MCVCTQENSVYRTNNKRAELSGRCMCMCIGMCAVQLVQCNAGCTPCCVVQVFATPPPRWTHSKHTNTPAHLCSVSANTIAHARSQTSHTQTHRRWQCAVCVVCAAPGSQGATAHYTRRDHRSMTVSLTAAVCCLGHPKARRLAPISIRCDRTLCGCAQCPGVVGHTGDTPTRQRPSARSVLG